MKSPPALKERGRALDVRATDRKMGTIAASAGAWFDLIRIFNVPVTFGGMLAGAFVATPSIDGAMWSLLIVAAISGCAAAQAFNDNEDKQTHARNASFRPPSTGLSGRRAVPIGGDLFCVFWAILSALVEPLAVLVVLAVYLLTRCCPKLKRVSLIHHFMLPFALGLMPVYGSLMAAHEVRPLSILVGISICFIDINVNIAGTLKDAWNGAEHQRVLPVVLGQRPAVSTALFLGVAGLFVQGAAVPLGLCGPGVMVPLGLGLALTVQSRLALHRSPNAEMGYAALRSGRLTECLTCPAVLAGLLPWWEGLAVIGLLTIFAHYSQQIASEAKLPGEREDTLTS